MGRVYYLITYHTSQLVLTSSLPEDICKVTDHQRERKEDKEHISLLLNTLILLVSESHSIIQIVHSCIINRISEHTQQSLNTLPNHHTTCLPFQLTPLRHQFTTQNNH